MPSTGLLHRARDGCGACSPVALGWHYLDSGALYRLTALARRNGLALLWDDEVAVARIAGGGIGGRVRA